MPFRNLKGLQSWKGNEVFRTLCKKIIFLMKKKKNILIFSPWSVKYFQFVNIRNIVRFCWKAPLGGSESRTHIRSKTVIVTAQLFSVIWSYNQSLIATYRKHLVSS